MNKIQVLMPMGGLGSRFVDAGYTTPKPLIEVDGKPMFLRALDSFSAIQDIVHIFVIRKEHDTTYNLKRSILDLLPDAKVLILDHDTQGAAETCMIAADVIDNELPLIVADCDIYFESSSYFDLINQQNSDAALLTFDSDDPRYSYVELDDTGKAVRTAEKTVISEDAILGGYYFSTGSLFKLTAAEFLAHELPANLKEYYLSHLFNILIKQGKSIGVARVDTKHIFGTPEELNQYLDNYAQF